MAVPIWKWMTTLLQAARDFGCDPCPGPKLEGWMKEAGFADVRAQKYKLPIGPWPKDEFLVRRVPLYTSYSGKGVTKVDGG